MTMHHSFPPPVIVDPHMAFMHFLVLLVGLAKTSSLTLSRLRAGRLGWYLFWMTSSCKMLVSGYFMFFISLFLVDKGYIWGKMFSLKIFLWCQGCRNSVKTVCFSTEMFQLYSGSIYHNYLKAPSPRISCLSRTCSLPSFPWRVKPFGSAAGNRTDVRASFSIPTWTQGKNKRIRKPKLKSRNTAEQDKSTESESKNLKE